MKPSRFSYGAALRTMAAAASSARSTTGAVAGGDGRIDSLCVQPLRSVAASGLTSGACQRSRRNLSRRMRRADSSTLASPTAPERTASRTSSRSVSPPSRSARASRGSTACSATDSSSTPPRRGGRVVMPGMWLPVMALKSVQSTPSKPYRPRSRPVMTSAAEVVTERPDHPYTAAVPEPGRPLGDTGLLPADPRSPPSGCRFRTCCPLADARCSAETPARREVAPGRTAACHRRLIS
ncbi:oligopeptide/dipeptide ABC transporter ATP-binding protein [Streptomyces sp. NPDC056638]|uniref:oligopeptide/dipeptide ABC transporter ATP-binding protein n=1 Tax=Streptomyces sp. NPDC056638 TaxID=3345887 RepID=UPI00369E22B5